MTSPDPEPETDTEPAVEFEAVDVDEIVRQERVRSIFDSRRTVREVRLEAKTGREPIDSFRVALEGYVREVEPLFAQTEDGQHYWRNRHYGNIVVEPTVEEMVGDTNKKQLADGTRVVTEPEARTVRVHGLNSLFQDNMAVEIEVEVPTVRRGKQTESKTVPVSPELPLSVLDEMYSGVNSYLAQIGFDVEVGKAEQHTKFDDDLVEELRDWREENL